MMILWGAQERELLAILADLREGRLIRAPESVAPITQLAPRVDRALQLVPDAPQAPVDDRWPDIVRHISEMERPAPEAAHMMRLAKQWMTAGDPMDVIFERLDLGRSA